MMQFVWERTIGYSVVQSFVHAASGVLTAMHTHPCKGMITLQCRGLPHNASLVRSAPKYIAWQAGICPPVSAWCGTIVLHLLEATLHSEGNRASALSMAHS